MKTLVVAVAIALVGIIVVFLALSLVGFDKSVAGPIATAIVGGIPYVRESLEKQGLSGSRRTTSHPVLSFEGYGMQPTRLILYGTLILFGAMNLTSGLGIMIMGQSAFVGETLHPMVLALIGVVVFPAAFLVGRWVGRRGVSKGIATIFLISAFARVTTSLLDLALLSPQEIAAVAGMPIWAQTVGGVAIMFLVGCWGYWRGRRQRLSAYLTYLLGRVSTDTREAIVELAYAEASRSTKSTEGRA